MNNRYSIPLPLDTKGRDYDEEGRVDRVNAHSQTYTVRYNDDHIEEVEVRYTGDYWVTTRYTYASGEVDGILPVPRFPWGNLFDLEGSQVWSTDPAAYG